MSKTSIEKLLSFTSNPIDFKIKDDSFYESVYEDYTLGLGESYINNFINIDTDNLIKLCGTFYEIFIDYKLNPTFRDKNPIMKLGYRNTMILNWFMRNLFN